MAQKTQISNLLRVTQMNAVYLDKEIVKCMQDGLQDAMKYLPVSFLDFEVMFVIFKYFLLTASSFGFSTCRIPITNQNCNYLLFCSPIWKHIWTGFADNSI